ncbi:MAG TPA: hypothetical protein VIA45_09970 [Thermoanaerobaculia bacterium]|jgi:hypothetical protein
MSWSPGIALDARVEAAVFARKRGEKVRRYSSDEQSALAVVVEMERQGWKFIEMPAEDPTGRLGWRCRFERRSPDPKVKDSGEFASLSRALAICVAALKAVRAA